MILNEFVAYALTTRRAIKIRRGALCGTSVASTDFRVMREVVATLDGNAQVGGWVGGGGRGKSHARPVFATIWKLILLLDNHSMSPSFLLPLCLLFLP